MLRFLGRVPRAAICTSGLVDQVRPVGDEAPGRDEEAVGVDRGQFVPGRKRNDQFAMN